MISKFDIKNETVTLDNGMVLGMGEMKAISNAYNRISTVKYLMTAREDMDETEAQTIADMIEKTMKECECEWAEAKDRILSERVWYYWYTHLCFSREEIEEIESSIREHDYNRYMELREKYNPIGERNGWGKESFFPRCGSAIGDIADVVDVTDREVFNKITFVEHECG